MKILPAVLTGICAGICAGVLTGWLPGGSGRPESAGPEQPGASRPPRVVRPPALDEPAREEAFVFPPRRPSGVRQRIRLEQSLLKLSPEHARRLLPQAGKEGEAAGDLPTLLLGWRAAGEDPAEALSLAGASPARAGILRRWLRADAAAALEACGTSGPLLKTALREFALLDPARCAATLQACGDHSSIPEMMNAWTARDPLQSRAWVEACQPKMMSDFYRGWMLCDAPAAMAAVSRLPYGGEIWAAPCDWMANAFSSLRMGNPEFAAESFRKLDPAVLLTPACYTGHMVSVIADRDLGLALRLAGELQPAALRDTALTECAWKLFDTDVNAALELARGIQTPAQQVKAVAGIAHYLGEMDPSAADPVMETLPPMEQYVTAINLLDDFERSAPALAEKWRARTAHIPLPPPPPAEGGE